MFVSILRDLSPNEAIVLRALYDEAACGAMRIDYESGTPAARFNPGELLIHMSHSPETPSRVAMPFGNFRVLADNLARLGLVEGSSILRGEYGPLMLSPLGHPLMMICSGFERPTKA